MDTSKPNTGIGMSGGSNSSGNTNTGSQSSNHSSTSNTAGNTNSGSNNTSNGSATHSTHSIISTAVEKGTLGISTDLYVIGSIIIAITVVIIGVIAVVRMLFKVNSETLPNFEIDMDDYQFAEEMFTYQEGEENQYFSDEFAQDFFDESNEQTPSTFAESMFADQIPESQEEQFASDMFKEPETESEDNGADDTIQDENYELPNLEDLQNYDRNEEHD